MPKYPTATIAGLKRALTPGRHVHIENHRRPHMTRDTTVAPKTNTVDLCTWAMNEEGDPVESHFKWPKSAALSSGPTPDVVLVHADNLLFLTITIGD